MTSNVTLSSVASAILTQLFSMLSIPLFILKAESTEFGWNRIRITIYFKTNEKKNCTQI